MNKHLKAFTILAWIGVAVNLAFAVPAFFAPDFLIDRLGIDEGFETVWLRNAAFSSFSSPSIRLRSLSRRQGIRRFPGSWPGEGSLLAYIGSR